MARSAFILAVDQGTTGSRAVLYNKSASVISAAYQEFPQIFPQPGWVEHDPEKIWNSVLSVMRKALNSINPRTDTVTAVGITNQRETTILWDARTGKPCYRAIVWQDRRTASVCEALRRRGKEEIFRKKTGLVLDPYFSGTKIAWILDHVKGLRRKAERGDILFGTVDSWLLWKLTGGKVHATDMTNASRTLLFNIHTRQWDGELLKLLRVPRAVLPEVKPSAADFGHTVSWGKIPSGIPIRALVGDQQAALYGQACYGRGQSKNTYGTGCFAMINLGPQRPKQFPHGLLGTLACGPAGEPVYALEGAVFIGGAVIQWIRDGLGLIRSAKETEAIVRRVKNTGGVTFIPAFSGLGSPYWNPHARGMISGITRGTTSAHLIRAALESIAHQSADVVEQMKKSGTAVQELKVDGGAVRNAFLMQFQADILQIPVQVSSQSESTAWGAAKLAARACGLWPSLKAVDRRTSYRCYQPRLSRRQAFQLRAAWKKEIQRVSL